MHRITEDPWPCFATHALIVQSIRQSCPCVYAGLMFEKEFARLIAFLKWMAGRVVFASDL
ncbi:hypothetical protein SUGI_0509210 [Cryptomeria japonica]|nr:hypothetical protein SUGI_0509210 [Cryptomeria japonica]